MLEISPLKLSLPASIELNEAQFFELCQVNSHLNIQRDTKSGEILIKPPKVSVDNLTIQLNLWTEKDGRGIAFDANKGFAIPGALAEPMKADAAWLFLERWQVLTSEQKAHFPIICPDFVVELRSANQTVAAGRKRMEEWIWLGVSLGWFIDRQNRQVYIYRNDRTMECLDNPKSISGEPLLSGFVLDLRKIW